MNTDRFLTIPAEEYHAASRCGRYMSSHNLADFRESPELYRRKTNGEIAESESPALALGRAAHCLILEGRAAFNEQFLVADGPMNPKTNEPYGKTTKAYAEWLAAQTREIVSTRDFGFIVKLQKSVWTHDCQLAFMFSTNEMQEQCANTVRLLAKKLLVEYLCLTPKMSESPLAVLSKITAELEYKKTASALEASWQGWTSTKLATLMENIGLKRGLQQGVSMMAMQILQPPQIPERQNAPYPVSEALYEKHYSSMLQAYFNLDDMYAALENMLGAGNVSASSPFSKEQLKSSLNESSHGKIVGRPQKGTARQWNSRPHGEDLFEPPRNGKWHEAHNAALFLQIVAVMVQYLLEPGPLDLERFRKDVRAMTAKLNLQYKDKINARNTTRTSSRTRNDKLNDIVRREVKRLLMPSLEKYKNLRNPNENEEK